MSLPSTRICPTWGVGARPACAGFVVHVPEQVEVKVIRRRLGLSQRRFAERFGFKLDAV